MKKYTANYTYTNPNFVIQNLVTNQTNADLLPILYVTKNILQRGFPTTLSKYLQSQLGEIHKLDNFEERFLFATKQRPVWNDTIKGDREHNYYPAKDFFENIIPNEFGEFSFIQSLLIPEIEINDITGEDDKNFINQQVDFYLPQAKLVIEIDGQQHKLDEVTRVSDSNRDHYLLGKGITTIRITTKELQNGTYKLKIEKILKHLKRYEKLLNFYKAASEKIEKNQISEEEIKTKLLPTAIIRFQILLIELLTHKYLTFDEDWNFNILAHEDIPDFAELAINDLLIWIDKLWQLKNKQELKKPKFDITITNDKDSFKPTTKAINIDFSLFKRYTDENKLSEDVIFVRTDYFDSVKDKNYFRVSTTEPINYNITDEDKPTLEFFLDNIFDKPSFLDGQFPIISNALNRKDTIGLLPTGGGKSLCYQLPCLLQPSINFVVCPIKSLMYDQNDNLVKIFITNVSYITSDLEAEEKREIERNFEQGRYLFVWISPERFQIPSFRDKISAIVANFSIAYAVVDEVHCLSEWGHDFRTSYLNLAKTIDKLSPKDENGEGKIKFIGLTATASAYVLKDIKIEFARQKQSLEDENIKSLLDYSRKELRFEVINDNGNKLDKLIELINELKDTESFIETTDKAGLIFTPNVNGAYGCYQLSNTLNTLYQNKVSWFSGDIPKRNVYDEKTGRKIGTEPVMSQDDFNEYKVKVQKDFKENKYQLLVATKAFGMGIDKQNIFYTFHYGLPASVEALYQEAGRAGRWDKTKKENRGKIAKCFVLHSPEALNQKKVERLFQKDTTFAEMKAISDEVGFGGKDIFKQVFLFVQGHNDIAKDFEIIKGIIKNYFKEKTQIRIFWNDAYSKLKINNDVLQKAIYRLSLLGIVSDWTTNFIDHFEVQFETLEENHIVKSVSEYISKYEPNTDISKEIQKIKQETVLDKAIWYLLNWTFENIAYSRKQSLKTLSEWCSEFVDSESFKQRIDSYFTFSETTFILQHIAEHPGDYEKWFEVLTTDNQFPNRAELEKLKDRIRRFLESYRNSVGLNFVSGFVRLALNEYEDSDGKERFESALSSVKETFIEEQQNYFLNRLKALGKHLTEEQRVNLTQSISRYYPEILEELAEYYNLAYLLNDVYAEKLKELKKLNRKLYEQLAEI
jgi:ATP-dependent DNA helicase RecQ